MAAIKDTLGICIGATTISLVFLRAKAGSVEILSTESIPYKGSPRLAIENGLRGRDIDDLVVVSTGRKYRKLINTLTISEPEAVEETIKFLRLKGEYGAIASLGGETFTVYCLDSGGTISRALTGNKCASGTGEFFLQQIRRMNLTVGESIESAVNNKPYSLSGRCSVFCKSDCTHALNKGIPKGEVVSGLSKMIAGKITELLAKQASDKIIVIGGVAQNHSVVDFIRERYPSLHVPEAAAYFEALGAALTGLERGEKQSKTDLFREASTKFSFLEPLDASTAAVKVKSIVKGTARAGDRCIIGLDVGSTTTKAVLLRIEDDAHLASVYLRTNGNPVKASVECYKALQDQVSEPVEIIGLGTTGSGRQIAGLHALTEGVVNEIIAHAVAAAYFNEDVDTIFEIGGQDAKYTYLTNGIASDYAMNEACSAGTGSFLEEAVKESFDIDYREIGDIALKSKRPPNFNDQCAAFISSDIKNAIHEGISETDIVAGLVYSICINYVNRVKGNRPVGNTIFMQGGVCYNKAVPVAMSKLLDREITVPPEPGLMGAFGVALEIKNRLKMGILAENQFDLDRLINREFRHCKDFICAGGGENCDLKCSISILEVDSKKYPFGGSCNKYYNERLKIKTNSVRLDYVKKRQNLVFDRSLEQIEDPSAPTVGILKSFLTNTLFPLYYNFFTRLGFRVILADEVDPKGIDRLQSSFCYPVEIAHGLLENLISLKPDFIFLPHITQIDNPHDENEHKKLCVFVQSEVYYLKTAFRDADLPEIISPIIDFTYSEAKIGNEFAGVAKQLGRTAREGQKAYDFAANCQREVERKLRELGREAIAELEAEPDSFGMVLFGRSYNAFAKEANLSIPHKFASKGIMIIPHDLLDSQHLPSQEHMYWVSGQEILQSAEYVKNHDQLFGVFVTNFSCGPDSFILPYFRKKMGIKPSLTLELDSHSADVGVDTRIDAAVDIIRNYIKLTENASLSDPAETFVPMRTFKSADGFKIVDQSSREFDFTSPDVELLIPSMGRFSSECLAAVFRRQGINASALPIPTTKTLNLGRSYTSCKECLPYILIAGSMVEQMRKPRPNGRKTLLFMPTATGPCRLGQYATGLKNLIRELRLDDIDVFTLTAENSYGGMGSEFFARSWVAITISDLMQDIENSILTLAVNQKEGLRILDEEWLKIVDIIETGETKSILEQLERTAQRLSTIELRMPISEAKVVSLIGEIYVRREAFSRLDLVETLAENGFLIRTAPVGEFVYYTNYLVKNLPSVDGFGVGDKIRMWLRENFQRNIERKIKDIMAGSGLVEVPMIDIDKTISHGKHLISDQLRGEGVLTAGLALREILDETCGIISIGPFACMPCRLAEAVLKTEMTLEGKLQSNGNKAATYPSDISSLPYLHFETDGNPFPQIIQSNIEIFMLQAEKMHQRMKSMERA